MTYNLFVIDTLYAVMSAEWHIETRFDDFCAGFKCKMMQDNCTERSCSCLMH